MHTGIALLFIATVILYCCYIASDHDTALFHLGVLSNFFTVMFFASPLSTLVHNLCIKYICNFFYFKG